MADLKPANILHQTTVHAATNMIMAQLMLLVHQYDVILREGKREREKGKEGKKRKENAFKWDYEKRIRHDACDKMFWTTEMMTNIHMQSLVLYYFLYYIKLHQIIEQRTITLKSHIIHLGKTNASKVLKGKCEGKRKYENGFYRNNIKTVWTGLHWHRIKTSGSLLQTR